MLQPKHAGQNMFHARSKVCDNYGGAETIW